ncbi:transposase [Xenorhabdus sp. PB62.4]|nr:transposase [Xenorhabdus sp. PB62.4]
MNYKYGSHTVFQIEYHFVWVTKYRYKVLTGEVALRVRELVRQTYEAFEIRILEGVVSQDHVYILVGYSPNLGALRNHEEIEGKDSE